jgi:hypothetical protein
MKDSFEGLQGAAAEHQKIDRSTVEQYKESYEDPDLDSLIEKLKTEGRYRLLDVLDHLDRNEKATKQKLGAALSMGGHEWGILDTMLKGSSPLPEKEICQMIMDWASTVELSGDDAAIRNAGKTLARNFD